MRAREDTKNEHQHKILDGLIGPPRAPKEDDRNSVEVVPGFRSYWDGLTRPSHPQPERTRQESHRQEPRWDPSISPARYLPPARMVGPFMLIRRSDFHFPRFRWVEEIPNNSSLALSLIHI